VQVTDRHFGASCAKPALHGTAVLFRFHERRGRLTQGASKAGAITPSEDRTVDSSPRCGKRFANSRNLSHLSGVNQKMPGSFRDEGGDTTAPGGHSIPKIALEFHRFYWYGGFLRYSAKRFQATQLKAGCWAVLVGSILWTVMVSYRPGSLNPIAASSKVVRLAGCLESVASAA